MTPRPNAPTVVVLGMLEAGYKTGYEVARAVTRSTSGFWPAGQNQIYPELRRLADARLIETQSDAVGGRPRERHTLTGAGRRLLDQWRLGDGELRIELRDEGLLKLHFGDRLTVAQARRILTAARGHRAERLEALRAVRPDPTGPRPGAYVSWRTGVMTLETTLAWYDGLLEALEGAAPAARALPRLARTLAEREGDR